VVDCRDAANMVRLTLSVHDPASVLGEQPDWFSGCSPSIPLGILLPLGRQSRTRGEVVLVGTAPAAGNAVCHATDTRFRRLPVRIEDLLASA
jgi:hypothetical protein